MFISGNTSVPHLTLLRVDPGTASDYEHSTVSLDVSSKKCTSCVPCVAIVG